MIASATLDLPTGATVVCAFGVTLLALGVVRQARRPSCAYNVRGMDNRVANWRLACLITLSAFLGLSVAAFATGLLPGDLHVREGLDGARRPASPTSSRGW